jgi:hypothetical protein
MDLFDSKKNPEALNSLINTGNFSDVHFAYQSWDQYLQDLASKQVKRSLAMNYSNFNVGRAPLS